MSRRKNQIETELFKVSTTGRVVDYLRDLTDTGLWGKNSTEAAERLLVESIRRLIADGTLKERKRK